MKQSDLRWNKIVKYLSEEVPGFRVISTNKIEKVWLAIYPVVLKPKNEGKQYRTLHHEGTHLFDAQSFFGLITTKLRWLNVLLFSIVYTFPQNLALLSLLAFINPWWLLCLLFALPLPAPGRALAELRAYRRSIELGADVEYIVKHFSSPVYYYMLPFPSWVRQLLQEPSPYKEELDKLL